MTGAIFPLTFASGEVRLLAGLAIGFLFGFALERGGFGNARKLAAQFYFYDMTVFKVMFTAILVAMVGIFTLAGAGVVDLAMLWINPTFVWAQAVGGFLLGVGFIMSGLCPGTAVVSTASGRYDGFVALAGIFVGTAVFAVAVGWFPQLEWLYETGGAVSILPEFLNIPVPVLVLLLVLGAGAAFIGAEKVERLFRGKYAPIELAPRDTRRTPRIKFALAGSLVMVTVVSLAWRPAAADRSPIGMSPVEPLALAEAIIAHDPNLLLLDMRSDRTGDVTIPGAFAVDDSTALPVLASVTPATRVVLIDAAGLRTEAPGMWPRRLTYRYLRGGADAWQAEVMTAAEPLGTDAASRELTERQHQMAAFFSGAAVSAGAVAPPPPVVMPSGGAKKKRAGGC